MTVTSSCHSPAQLLASLTYFPLSATHEPSHEFHIPISTPVTLSPRHFSVLLFQSLQFIGKNNISKTGTKIDKTNTYDTIDDYKIHDIAVKQTIAVKTDTISG